MSIWLNRIEMGFELYTAAALFLIAGLAAMLIRRKVNMVRFSLRQLFGLYLCCLAALVFLPLPTLDEAAELTYRCQLVPFYFIYDMMKNPSVDCIFCVIFNVVMTVPFGMFLRTIWGLNRKQILLASLALTIFIEFGQLTGLFFIFHGSYRLCDMDDIITNTFGGYLGFLIISKFEVHLPALDSFDLELPALHHRHAHHGAH